MVTGLTRKELGEGTSDVITGTRLSMVLTAVNRSALNWPMAS